MALYKMIIMVTFWNSLSPTTAEVHIVPATPISPTGGGITFNCILATAVSDDITGVRWIVNGSSIQDLNLTNVMTHFSQIGVGVGILTFTDIPPSYNETSVQCAADLQLGNTDYSNIAMLVLQGTLSAVGSLSISLQDNVSNLTWSAPFTLDITATTVDIMYCVDVVNSTSSTLYSECGITETEFTYLTPPGSECEGVTFTVTPVNAAGVGIPNSIPYSQALAPPWLMEESRKVLESAPPVDIIVYEINMTAPVCSAHISLVDLKTREEVTLYEADISTQGSTVVFTSERLTLNRRYHVTITAANINGSAISNIDAISTHDILAVGIDPDSGGIHVQYSVNTRAMGSLLLFMFISNGEVDFSRSVHLTLDRNSSHDYTLPFQLLSGWYIISAYDIEESGLVQGSIAYPAFTETLFITTQNINSFNQPTSTSSDFEDCNITTSEELTISILCTNTPDSVATGYHVIVQRNILDNSEVSNLYVSESSGPNPATVQVDREGDYHVTVFPINEETGIVGTAVAYSAPLTVSRESESDVIPNSMIITGVGVGLGVLVMVVVILAGVILAVQCRKMKTVKLNKDNIPTQPEGRGPKEEALNVVYEEIGDVVDTFKLTQNILYGVPSPAGEGVTVPEASQERNQEYEDVKSVDLDVSLSRGAYHMGQCSAYGVNN